MNTRTRLPRLFADACIVVIGLWIAVVGFGRGDPLAVLATLGIA